MIKIVSRISLWGVVLLALSGCFQTLNSPLAPTNTPDGGVIAVQPTTEILPTETPVVQPTIEQPTLEGQPTIETTPEFPPTDIPVPTDITPEFTVEPTIDGQANIQPTMQVVPPTEIPTDIPLPTQIPPTETPVPPTETPLPTATPLMTETFTPSPTFTSTVRVGPTLAPPQDGANGTIDANCIYTVEQDDRLLRIALRFNRTLDEMRLANPAIVNTNLIYLGQKLVIPECNTR